MNNGRIGRVVMCVLAVGMQTATADAKPRRRPPPVEQKAPPAPTPAPAPAPAPAPPQDDTPWGKGVSAEHKATAQRLLGEGNDLFVQNNFREALARYEQAVASWDHPAIRFNMVRTLIALDRPLDASRSLERALAYGAAPLEEHMYTEALNYQRLLAGQIAEYEVTCKQPGVTVKVDGESLLECPGTKGKQTTPGTHVVVGAKDGYLTHTQDLVLMPGKKQPIVIELITIEKATVYRSRWSTWKPWAVVAGGAAIAGVGVLLNAQASGDMERLERLVEGGCAPSGCTSEQYTQLGYADAESSALTKNKIALGVMATGGAVVIGGVIAVIMNRPKPFVSERRQAVAPMARVIPTMSPDGIGLAAVGSF